MPLILLLAKATLLLIGALLVARILARASAGSRHLVWLVSLAALIALPLIATWAPLGVHVLPAPVAPAAGPLPVNHGDRNVTAQVLAPPVSTLSPSPAPATTATRTDRAIAFVAAHRVAAALALWGAIAFLFCAWLAYGNWSVRRIIRRAEPLDEPDWRRSLYEIADRLDITRTPRILRSDDARMPFAAGMLHPVVVLPADSAAWSEQRRTAVLIHELAHIRRRDLISHTIGRLACALYWFHPMVWTAARRLRSESERACDDLALAFGERPSEYAEHLLDIVTRVRNHATPSVALAMAHRKEFEGRMLAILDPDQRRDAPGRFTTGALVGGLALVALFVCAAAPVPAATTPNPVAGRSATETPNTIADRPALKANTGKHAGLGDAGVHVTVRIPAFAAIDSLPRGDRATLLARLLRNDSAPSVRRVAAWGLKPFSDDSAAAGALAAALTSDRDADVRAMAAWAFEDGGGSRGTTALSRAARNDSDEDVREMAIWALTQRDDTAAVAVCRGAVTADRSDNVRRTCAWSFGELRPAHAGTALVAALRDSDTDTRDNAAWALGEVGDSAALPALRDAMRSEKSTDVLALEMRALIRSGEDPSRMVEWLRSPNADIREMTARALAGGGATNPMPRPEPRPIPFP